ncbi:MAG: DNA-binding response OmpR family regulator [Oceanicoccus sp.]|jgi:DNA-binding response OmpR family regulator
MASNAGSILSRSQLFKLTRGIDYNGLDRSVDVRISHLRKKLYDNLDTPFRIKTIWGKGYLFIEDAWE